MKNVTKVEFRSYKGEYLAFTDDSVIFANSELKEAKVFPLGSIKKITALFGVKLISNNGDAFFFSFLHMRKRIKRKIIDLVARTSDEKSLADEASPYTVSIEEVKKQSIEQIRKPHISRKAIIKFWVSTITLVFTALILITLVMGIIKEQSSQDVYSPSYNGTQPTWQEQWK